MSRKHAMLVFAVALLLQCGDVRSLAQSLYTAPEGVETRWASPENPLGDKAKGAQTNAGRKGRPAIPVKAGEQVTLAEVHGSSGTVRRIEATISDRSPAMLRGLKIEMFWDGSKKPAVSAPFGDFFGHGLGHMATFQSALFSSPEGRSFNCYIPMPFKTGMKIVLTNESGKNLELLFYDVDYTLGDKHDISDLYFHAHFRRENPTKLQRDFEILPWFQERGGSWEQISVCKRTRKSIWIVGGEKERSRCTSMVIANFRPWWEPAQKITPVQAGAYETNLQTSTKVCRWSTMTECGSAFTAITSPTRSTSGAIFG